jgi:hypothetical protein
MEISAHRRQPSIPLTPPTIVDDLTTLHSSGLSIRGVSFSRKTASQRSRPRLFQPRTDIHVGVQSFPPCTPSSLRGLAANRLTKDDSPGRIEHRQAAKLSCVPSINVKHKVDLHLPYTACCSTSYASEKREHAAILLSSVRSRSGFSR